jgi:hypothetical protein
MKRIIFFLSAFFLVGLVAIATERDDARLARLSYLEGRVSFQAGNDVDWAAASINMALQPSDRVYTGESGRAEIEFDDGSVLRLAEKTDIEVLSLKDDLIQIRILLGLATLTVGGSVNYEIDTPAAAFNTLSKGVYRFDVAENGDSDGIVRKGLLEAANNDFSQRAESGELIHVTPGDSGTHLLSRYDRRDDWDEWNDRRNADMNAYESRKYIPEFVTVGVGDLDRYGRWVTVADYGPAWVPSYVDPSWSPYWDGRWCYRPFWGWTWISYEPWGWLPYHYGRWHHHSSFGWCWLPGASFSFHFWSPGLVRFFHGPNWMSWCALGPGDYYNVNNYYYHRGYNYHLNSLRLLQRRSPEDLANRHIPGAFRTVSTDSFVNNSLGKNARMVDLAGDQPWKRGRMVLDQPDVQPTSRSLAPIPDRLASRPTSARSPMAVLRSEPSVQPGQTARISRITNPSIPQIQPQRSEERRGPGGMNNPTGRAIDNSGSPSSSFSEGAAGRVQENRTERGSSIWSRGGSSSTGNAASEGSAGRTMQTPAPGSINGNPRTTGREVPGNRTSRWTSPSPSTERSPSPSTIEKGTRENSRQGPGSSNVRPETSSPRRMESGTSSTPRYEKPSTPSRSEPERAKPEARPRPQEQQYSSSYATGGGRSYSSQPSDSITRSSQPERWQSQSRNYSAPSFSGSASSSWSGRSSPSYNRSSPFGGSQSGGSGSGMRSAPSRAPSGGGGGSGIQRRQGRE